MTSYCVWRHIDFACKRKFKKHWHLIFLIVFFHSNYFPVFGQTILQVSVSLKHIGRPEFPTGYWFTASDPHFRHSQDRIFWLSSRKIATTFFNGYCCGAGQNASTRFRAAVFDLADNKISTHDWISRPDDPFYVGGQLNLLWVRYRNRLVLLRPDYTIVRQFPLSSSTHLEWSKSGNSFGLEESGKLSIYHQSWSSPSAILDIPETASVVDVHGDSALLTSKPGRPCNIQVIAPGGISPWNLDVPPPNIYGNCYWGIGLLSESAVLVEHFQPEALQIFYRNGRTTNLKQTGELSGIANSGRIGIQAFYPNPIATFLDMDFGGHKVITVYETSTMKILFHKLVDAQGDAVLSPDGHHLAIIEKNVLLIYQIP